MAKICSGCKISKPINDFYKEKQGAQGVKGKCKECIKKIKEKYRNENKDKIRQATKKYYENPAVRQREAQYRHTNRDLLKLKRS